MSWPAACNQFVRHVQAWLGVTVDGKPGRETWAAWREKTEIGEGPRLKDAFHAARVMFPDVPLDRLHQYLPLVVEGLKAFGIYTPAMLLMALATIRAETADFKPISEGKSRYNTSPSGHPFDLYDNRTDLGNRGKPDGESFKGRGFVQLTGRDNYRRIGERVGVDLEAVPALANDPRVAARILAAFLESRRAKIVDALRSEDLPRARRLINGGSHGLDRFKSAYQAGRDVLSKEVTT